MKVFEISIFLDREQNDPKPDDEPSQELDEESDHELGFRISSYTRFR